MFSPMRDRSQNSPAAAAQVLQRIRGGIALSLNSQDVLHAPCEQSGKSTCQFFRNERPAEGRSERQVWLDEPREDANLNCLNRTMQS